ncbi:hypothetical protein M405DRAFT_830300, partial [Rhizopogon salebrosus TDB-379]
LSEPPDAVNSLVSFFCRGRAGLPPYGTYQSLNHGFLPCPVTCPPRDTVNDGD